MKKIILISIVLGICLGLFATIQSRSTPTSTKYNSDGTRTLSVGVPFHTKELTNKPLTAFTVNDRGTWKYNNLNLTLNFVFYFFINALISMAVLFALTQIKKRANRPA